MRRDELRLYGAIYDVRQEMEANDEEPGADSWITDDNKRLILTKRVIQKLINACDATVISAWGTFRKSGTVDGVKKLELLVQVARSHGDNCFYAHRGLGDCVEEIDLDRLIAGGMYSVANCVIACSKHNRMRGDKTIDEFLRSASCTI